MFKEEQSLWGRLSVAWWDSWFYHYWSKVKYWFLYRFHPKHRYHVLDLRTDYRYSDPRHRMIMAVMACVEEYVDELRYNIYDGRDMSDLSSIEVVLQHIEYAEKEIKNPAGSSSVDRQWTHDWYVEELSRLSRLYHLLVWWYSVKDNHNLDNWSDEIPSDKEVWDIYKGGDDGNFYDLSYEEVDRRLKEAIDLRTWMWT